jgi:hypothetical protein
MNGMTLVEVFDSMKTAGLVASRREFSRSWCGKGQTYLADYIEDHRLDANVPGVVVERLRSRLDAVAALVPAGAAREIGTIVERIDTARRVHAFLAR